MITQGLFAFFPTIRVTGVKILPELFVYLFYASANDGDVSYVPALVVCVLTAIVMPLVTYPFAKTGWAAIDLAMRPLDPVEEADAALHAANAPPPDSVDPA